MSYHIVNIDTANCSLSCRDGQLICKTSDGERKLPLEDVACIVVTSFSASIHSHLLIEAAKHGVRLDPTFGIGHVPRERSTPLAYDLMEPFRSCVEWRVFQWAKQNSNNRSWEVTKEFRKWITGFPVERVQYSGFTLEVQNVIEAVVRSFHRAVIEGQAHYYRPWTPRNLKWAG